MDMCEDEYSVIMTAFEGDSTELARAAPARLGYEGGSLSALVLRDELPSEVAADLSADEAGRVSAALEALGATTKVVRFADVADVKHRAYELFTTREGKCFSFTETDGMIFTLTPLVVRRVLKQMRERDSEQKPWDFEYHINHEHVGFIELDGTLRELIHKGNEMVEQLKQDLGAVYPHKSFVISHDLSGNVVSFYQALEDAPTEARPTDDRNPKGTWCMQCGRKQPYLERTETDAEFPEINWGDCAVCGSEVLIPPAEMLILVGPE